jgi:glycosyltransferase involved in cell wall biosynthesis
LPIKTKRKKLTILQVGTVSQPIRTDRGYGPIEMVIHDIDQGLHSLGHRSIVACSGDSKIAGEHYVTIEKNIGSFWGVNTPSRRENMNTHLYKVLDRIKIGDIDIIHTHESGAVKFIYDEAANMNIPIVMTLHLEPQDNMLEESYQRCCSPISSPLVHCVSISQYQKKQYQGLVSTKNVVYHGIEPGEYPAKDKSDKENYLFTISRITRNKGQDKAIEIAKKTGSKLIIAGCVQNKTEDKEFFANLKKSIDLVVEPGEYCENNNNYYEKVIKPLVNCDKQIIYIGEISCEQKKQWFAYARATLFPIQWGEPFGLVMIESMACGTPVIALNKGSVPEIIINKKTGFVIDTEDEMAEAVKRIDSIDPRQCRQHVQDNFSITRMANNYCAFYRQVINSYKPIKNTGDLLGKNKSAPVKNTVIVPT